VADLVLLAAAEQEDGAGSGPTEWGMTLIIGEDNEPGR
jgi:hypothetical protein